MCPRSLEWLPKNHPTGQCIDGHPKETRCPGLVCCAYHPEMDWTTGLSISELGSSSSLSLALLTPPAPSYPSCSGRICYRAGFWGFGDILLVCGGCSLSVWTLSGPKDTLLLQASSCINLEARHASPSSRILINKTSDPSLEDSRKDSGKITDSIGLEVWGRSGCSVCFD